MFDFLKKKERAEIARLQSEVERLSKYSKIADVDSEIDRRYKELAIEEAEHQQRLDDINNEIAKLNESYKRAKAIYDDLLQETEVAKESSFYAEFGLIEPKHNISTKNDYHIALAKNRVKQKQIIGSRIIYKNRTEKSTGAVCGLENIDDYKTHDMNSLIINIKKLMLRAFNKECDKIISSVSLDNLDAKWVAMRSSYNAINKLFEDQGIYILESYFNCKDEELKIAWEYESTKEIERARQKVIREQLREDEKVRREYEAAIKKAEKDEVLYNKALEKAREELSTSIDGNPIKLQNKIAELEARLKEAIDNKQRALSMAQQTKRGHVYIISNIGSFGENIFKIGMTRRLDPYDRVIELSDASVPFKFDVHAMIFSEDAPALENALHKRFADSRLNMINNRKEFFYATIEEIEQVITESCGEIEFTKDAEATQYRQSAIIRGENNGIISVFPDTL